MGLLSKRYDMLTHSYDFALGKRYDMIDHLIKTWQSHSKLLALRASYLGIANHNLPLGAIIVVPKR